MKRFLAISTVLLFVMACGIFAPEVIVVNATPQPTNPSPVIIVITATSMPETQTQQPTDLPKPKNTKVPEPTASPVSFVSSFQKIPKLPCSYFVTGNGLDSNTKYELDTNIRMGGNPYVIKKVFVKTNAAGHFSQHIFNYSDLAQYAGYQITTVIYSTQTDNHYIADAVETVPFGCD